MSIMTFGLSGVECLLQQIPRKAQIRKVARRSRRNAHDDHKENYVVLFVVAVVFIVTLCYENIVREKNTEYRTSNTRYQTSLKTKSRTIASGFSAQKIHSTRCSKKFILLSQPIG